MTFFNSDAAFRHAFKVLEAKGFTLKSYDYLNQRRHCLVQVEEHGRRSYFYLVFKKAFFYSFNALAKEFINKNPDNAGFGESINVEWLERARSFSAGLLFIYPDSKIYLIHSITLWKFVHENQLIRDQERLNHYKELHDGNLLSIQKYERTAYFPINWQEFMRYY